MFAFLVGLATDFNFWVYLFTVSADVFDAVDSLFAELGVVLTGLAPSPLGMVYLTTAGLLVSLVV